MEQIMSDINVSLTIPGTKVMACAMDVMHNYEPLVQEALEEVRDELNFDVEFQQKVKAEVKERLMSTIESAIEKAAHRVVTDAYLKSYQDIEDAVRNTVLKNLNYGNIH